MSATLTLPVLAWVVVGVVGRSLAFRVEEVVTLDHEVLDVTAFVHRHLPVAVSSVTGHVGSGKHRKAREKKSN
jgi:hypothetical protein